MGRKEVDFEVEKSKDQRKVVIRETKEIIPDTPVAKPTKSKDTKEEPQTWSEWLHTPEGAEKLKTFVILQSLFTMALTGMPFILPHLQDVWNVISKFLNFTGLW